MIDWRHWHNEPYLVGGLVLIGWLWAVCAGPLRSRLAPGVPFPRGQAWRFYGSLLIFYLAVGSPLDQIGDTARFSGVNAQFVNLAVCCQGAGREKGHHNETQKNFHGVVNRDYASAGKKIQDFVDPTSNRIFDQRDVTARYAILHARESQRLGRRTPMSNLTLTFHGAC